MPRKASRPAPDPGNVRVRFLRQVKSGGRWYDAGEVSIIGLDVSRDLEKAGLIERLESKPRNTRKTVKGGSSAVSNR